VGLRAALGRSSVALDTAAFICVIEEHPRYLPLLAPLLREADEGRRQLVTSALTLLEVLVVPYRAGDAALAERYEMLLTRGRGLDLVDLDRAVLLGAAQLRARTRIRTPDALQLAAALLRGCSAFVTNDRKLPEVAGLRVVQLGDYSAY
jgi:predicted nucleic acid-binding protein